MVPLLLLLRPRWPRAGRPFGRAVPKRAGDFLADRSREIEALLQKGVAVCLPDVRGVGETKPDQDGTLKGGENTQANNELMLGETLLGGGEDLRTVFSYLDGRQDLDSRGSAFGRFGCSGQPLGWRSTTPQWQVGRTLKAGPSRWWSLGVLALYTKTVTCVAGGWAVSYVSILADRFATCPRYLLPGILAGGDLPDIAASAGCRDRVAGGVVDGRNRLLPEALLQQELEPLYRAYKQAGDVPLTLQSSSHPKPGTGFLVWLLTCDPEIGVR